MLLQPSVEGPDVPVPLTALYVPSGCLERSILTIADRVASAGHLIAWRLDPPQNVFRIQHHLLPFVPPPVPPVRRVGVSPQIAVLFVENNGEFSYFSSASNRAKVLYCLYGRGLDVRRRRQCRPGDRRWLAPYVHYIMRFL